MAIISRAGSPHKVSAVRRLATALSLLLVYLVTACGALPVPGMNGGAASGVQPGNLLPQLPQAPSDTLRRFLDAWNTRDYPQMYTLLASNSQGNYTLPVFQGLYENVANAIDLDQISYRIGDTVTQGTTAAVQYDLTLTSPLFGTISDPNRTMRLVQTPAGWRVAWSTMDIFDGLAANARVQVDSNPPPRGNIYDRTGTPLVEENGTILELYMQQLVVPDLLACYKLLGTALRRDYHEIEEQAADKNLDTVFFVGDIDPEAYAARAAQLADTCGISRESGLVLDRTDRRYVGHGAATHITGYIGQAGQSDIDAGLSPGDFVGKAGIEAAYDERLRGQAVRVLRITEPGGTVIRDLGGAEGAPAEDVTLTIDRDLQIAAAQALYDAYMTAEINWGARSPGAGVAIVHVHSGAILALASYPTFDPGLFSPDTSFEFPGAYLAGLQADPNGAFFNRVTQGQYAPGSVFKIVTTAAAANERVVGPDDLFYCDLNWENGPRYGDTLAVRLDWRASEILPEDRFPTGDVTISQALASSCDPFYYEMGAKLFQRGPTLLSEYARGMGLGRSYGLEPVFAEAVGVIPNPTSVEQAINEAIGQGDVQVTLLQMANAVAAVANGGTLYQPYVVERVGREGESVSFQAQPQAISQLDVEPDALEIVRQGMCDVTRTEARNTTNGRPLGTAWFVFENTYYSICGKTGTAQTNSDANAWFVAYVPADNPQIAIAVMVERAGREGSEVAAPIVRRILDDYLNVPPQYFGAFPNWWTEPFVPLMIAEGGTGG